MFHKFIIWLFHEFLIKARNDRGRKVGIYLIRPKEKLNIIKEKGKIVGSQRQKKEWGNDTDREWQIVEIIKNYRVTMGQFKLMNTSSNF